MGTTQSSKHWESYSLNPLDEAPVFCFDPHQSSTGLIFTHSNQRVTFPSKMSSFRIAIFNKSLKTGFINQTLSVRLKIQYRDRCRAVIGFGEVGVSAMSPSFEDFYVFDVTAGKVFLSGREVPNVTLPRFQSGDTVELQIDVKMGMLKYFVCSPSKVNFSSLSFKLDGNIPAEINPMVGALQTEQTNVMFDILEAKELSSIEESIQFDKTTKYGPIVISENGCTVSRNNVNSNCCVAINKILQSGQHRWKFKILCDTGASTCLGLATYPFTIPSRYSNNHNHLYWYEGFTLWRSYGGLLYAQGRQLSQSLASVEWLKDENPIIELVLDLTAGTLEIILNGRSQGIAFESIKPPVQPIVVFYAGYEKKIQLLNFHSEDVSSSPIILKLPKEPASKQRLIKPSFDAKTVHGLLTISPDGMTLTRDQNQSGNAYCLLNKICTSGVYRWSFLIKNDQGASLCLGITTEPVHLPANDNIYASKSMHLYRSYQGKLYRNGKELSKCISEFWMTNTVVEIVLDMENGVLQFIVNNENQGVAFAGLHDTYRPIVALYASMTKCVYLQKFEHIPAKITPLTFSNSLNDPTSSSSDVKNDSGLSICGNIDDIPEKSDTCFVCSVTNNNVILLPCKHVIVCAAHAVVGEQCMVCERTIKGIWNVF